MRHDKAALRFRLRTMLASLPEPLKWEASSTLRRHLKSWPLFQQAPVVALFHSTDSEPNLLPLLQIPEKTFLFPRCHPDGSLTWHAPDGIERWRPSPFGIIEPDPALSPPVPATSIALVLVPGLAFTIEGDRLGHGAGFYDRFLATIPAGTSTAGICFSCQILENLPAEPHDIRVHAVFHA